MASRFTPRSATLALATLTTALLMSCGRDQITTPQTRGIHASGRANQDFDPAQESPALANATVSASGIDVMPNQRAKIGTYPTRTIVELQISQSITIAPLVSGLTGGGLALGGRLAGGSCVSGQARIESGDPNPFDGCSLWGRGGGGANNWTDTIGVHQDAYVVHTTDSPGFGSCSSNCYEYSGSTSAILLRLDLDFKISAGSVHGVFFDSATVNAGELVTFGAQATQQYVHDIPVGVFADGTTWRFVADDGEVTTGCPGGISGYYCNMTMTKSGTMHVSSYVNGAYKPELRAVRVTVQQAPRIVVTCLPATITRASATNVSCTASASGAVVLTRWKFTPADQAIDTVTSSQSSLSWAGVAVASGAVTVQGTVNGVTAISDTGRIVVTSRVGWNWSSAKSTGDAPTGRYECNTARHYVVPGNFGWTTADSACKNTGLMLWPDPTGVSSKRGWQLAKVPSGPNSGLWYATSDNTGMHIRAQILKDIRPDGFSYSVNGTDTVAKRCKSAGVKSSATVTVVNNTCMQDPSAFNFAALYAFAWKHERCHLTQFLNVFPTIADPRTKLETIVRSDTGAFNQEALIGQNGYYDANAAITGANTIDHQNPQSYTFWSRNTGNSAWLLRTYVPLGVLAPECP